MAAHTKDQREFIVRRLARGEPCSRIAVNFSLIFPDTRCSEEDVKALDPSLVLLSPELYEVFATERKRLSDDPDAAPYAHQWLRLIALSDDVVHYRNNNQRPEARAVMRMLAEETGVVGGKATGAKVAPGVDSEPVTEIRRVVVYPPEVAPEEKARNAEGS